MTHQLKQCILGDQWSGFHLLLLLLVFPKWLLSVTVKQRNLVPPAPTGWRTSLTGNWLSDLLVHPSCCTRTRKTDAAPYLCRLLISTVAGTTYCDVTKIVQIFFSLPFFRKQMMSQDWTPHLNLSSNVFADWTAALITAEEPEAARASSRRRGRSQDRKWYQPHTAFAKCQCSCVALLRNGPTPFAW